MSPRPDLMTANVHADALEERCNELDEIVVKSILHQSGDVDPASPRPQPSGASGKPRHFPMREDPRLRKMPESRP